MNLYHGSPNKFNKFNFDHIRTNGTTEGIGFYFTDNKQIANGYASNGYLYTINLNGKKEISSNERTLTRNELKKFITVLQNNDIDYLSNFGDVSFSGYNNVLNDAIDSLLSCNDDVELLCDIYNAQGDNENIISLFVDTLGYDHYKTNADWGNQTLYIALDNNIIDILSCEAQ